MENENNNQGVVVAEGIDGPRIGGFSTELGRPKQNGEQKTNQPWTEDGSQTFEVTAVVPYTDAADANYYPIFYTANVRCYLIEARMKHGAVGGANAAVRVERLTSGTARGSGMSMLSSAFDLTTGANVTQWRTETIVLAGFQLNPGDAMALRASGTLTGAEHVTVTVLLGIDNKNIPTGPSVSVVIAGI